MLEEINITNLGVIETATLEFTPGLNVLTGETGAGKTMVLTALGLLLGKRTSSDIVRHGTNHTSVEGCWNLENNTSILPLVKETGAVVEDNTLYINRTVYATGKNRIVLGGKTTPASILAGFGDKLVSIHGQADQIRLKTSVAQRDALDKYAGTDLAELKLTYRTQYKKVKTLLDNLNDLKKNSVHRKREYELYKQALEDFNKVTPTEDEDEALKAEILTLSHVDTIREAVTEASNSISSEDTYDSIDPLVALANAVRLLSSVAEYDEEVRVMLTQAEGVLTEAQELSSSLNNYLSNMDIGSLERLAQAQERLASINTLIRKYGSSLEEALAYWNEAEAKVETLNPENNDLDVLEEEYQNERKVLTGLAEEISALRVTAAKSLSSEVNEELAGLAMSGSQLVVNVEYTNSPTPHGADEISFLLKTPGSSVPKPIAKTASGGELSRIMLALEVVLADPTETATFVYDEVDAGIGGAVAIEIGKRLSRLARDAQVIVVSHLGQVAAFADNHLLVSKTATENNVKTTVTMLDEESRLSELARLLSGLADSEHGKANALELLQIAEETRMTV